MKSWSLAIFLLLANTGLIYFYDKNWIDLLVGLILALTIAFIIRIVPR